MSVCVRAGEGRGTAGGRAAGAPGPGARVGAVGGRAGSRRRGGRATRHPPGQAWGVEVGARRLQRSSLISRLAPRRRAREGGGGAETKTECLPLLPPKLRRPLARGPPSLGARPPPSPLCASGSLGRRPAGPRVTRPRHLLPLCTPKHF